MAWKRCALLLVGLALACAGTVPSQAEVPRMTKEELRTLMGRADVVVVDVRAGGDWTRATEKIAGAVREEPGAEATWASKYPKDTTLVFYCA
jgi:rhodanese-related sulfurtransferase